MSACITYVLYYCSCSQSSCCHHILQGCVDAVVDRISDQIGVIAGVSIAIAVLLVRYT